MNAVSGTAVLFALLQSVCTAVFTINSVRVGIGLAALAAGTVAQMHKFHGDAIRIPMLVIAVVGAVLNLIVLAWVRHLRNQPGAQWRRRELTKKQTRSERIQVILAVLTLVLVAAEEWTHTMLHHHHHHA